MQAAGKPPSARPKISRMTIRDVNDHASPVSAVKIDHATAVPMTTYFDPNRSASQPPGSCISE